MMRFLAIVMTLTSFSTASSSANDNAPTPKPVVRVLIASIKSDTTDALIQPERAETAIILAFQATNRFACMPTDLRDSILLARGLTQVSTLDAATDLQAQAVLYATFRSIGNLIRCELVLADGEKYYNQARGAGFALVKWHRDSTEEIVADPALLLSAQRALMECLKDSALYASADTVFHATQAPLTVVGGIDFSTTSDTSTSPQWSLFKERMVTAYHGVQTITEVLAINLNEVVIDVATRDSMQAKARLYLIQNDVGSTTKEMQIYRAFGAEQAITGTCSFADGVTIVTLTRSEILTDGRLKKLASHSELVKEDNKMEFQTAVQRCAEQLMR